MRALSIISKPIFLAIFFLSLQSSSEAASRYWVGGTALWDATVGTKWSTTSGGAGGSAVPTSSDDVFFDANSGANVITVSGTRSCKSIDFTGFTGTIAGASTPQLNIGTSSTGNIIFVSGMTWSMGGTLNFTSTVGTNLITFNGLAINSSFTFNATGGVWQLQDAMTTNQTVTLTFGTFDTNGKTCIWNAFSSNNTNTRTLTLGASSITITGTGIVWSCGTVGTFTVNPGTSVIELTGNNVTFNGATKTYYEVKLTGSGSGTLDTGNTFTNFRRIGSASISDTLIAGAGASFPTQTITGVLELKGNSPSNRLLVTSLTRGNQWTFTCNGSVSITDVDFRDTAGAGSASPFTGTRIGNALGNSGITTTTVATRYWVGSGGNWSDATNHWATSSGGSGGVNNYPLPQDTIVFDSSSVTSGSQTITMDEARAPKIDFTGVTNNPTFNISVAWEIYGDLKLVSGMTWTGGQSLLFQTRSTSTKITTAGVVLGTTTIGVRGTTNTVTQQDNLVTGGNINTQNAATGTPTWNTNASNYSLTLNAASTTGSTAFVMNSSTVTFTGTGSVGSWTSFPSAATANIILSDISATSKTWSGGFAVGSLTLPASAGGVTVSGASTYTTMTINGGGNGTISITGTNTIHSLIINPPKKVQLTASTTQTIDTAFTVNGIPCQHIRLSSSSSTNATLSISGVAIVSYLDASDITVSGTSSPITDTNGTDEGGANSGITFSVSSPKDCGATGLIGSD